MIFLYVAVAVVALLVVLEANPSTRGLGLRVWAWWRRQAWTPDRGKEEADDEFLD